MEFPGLTAACRGITDELRGSVAYLRDAAPDDRLYAVALVSREGLDYTTLYWAYHKPLVERQRTRSPDDYGKRMVDKWSYAEWILDADEVDTGLLQAALPEEPGYESSDYQGLRGALMLWSLAGCLRQLAVEGVLEHRGRPVVAFCSLFDSGDAGWVERETARHVNPPGVFAGFEAEHIAFRAARGDRPEPTPSPLQEYYRRLGCG